MQQLAEKTNPIAAQWKPVADAMFSQMPQKEKRRIKLFKRAVLFRD
jgi:hypothetical protein